MDGGVAFASSMLVVAFTLDLYSKLKRGLMDSGRNVATDADIIDSLTARVRQAGLSRILYGVTVYPGTCSYCENRSRVYLKLRKDDGSFYDSRTLLYVFVHELAHVGARDDGGDYHGPSFVRAFKRLLAKFPELQETTTAPDDYTQNCAL